MATDIDDSSTRASTLLREEARNLGWLIPEGTLEQIEAACMEKLERIGGGQDRSHARNGIRSAIEAARAGNAEYVRAGLWEAKKTLSSQHWDHHWDDEPARLDDAPTDENGAKVSM